jgi:flagellar basal-body rod modification protein FlgD
MALSSMTANATDIRADFMTLLVAQLRNQNPLEPLDNNQMASQLAQLSSLEQLEGMSRTFRDVLASQERLQALELIGKEVDYLPEGQDTVATGRVEAVHVTEDGIRLSIGDDEVDLAQVQAIREVPAAAAPAAADPTAPAEQPDATEAPSAPPGADDAAANRQAATLSSLLARSRANLPPSAAPSLLRAPSSRR